MVSTFNLTKTALKSPKLKPPEGTPKRIKDRGIDWEEHYTERTDDLKVRFDKTIGQGAYHRWEGHDNYTNSDYFVVVGPAKDKNGHKRWFAGVKKLPDNPKKKHYAPSGEYFSTLHGALSHASDKWGVPFPQGQPNYTQEQLQSVEIPRHIKG